MLAPGGLALFCTRMRGVVGFGQVLKIEVSIDLGRADIGVPQHLLHGAQVAARLQHVGSKAVAQHVRVDIAADTLFDRPLLHAVLHGTGADALAAMVDEEGRFVVGGDRNARGKRSEERRVGKECQSTCRSRWSPYH